MAAEPYVSETQGEVLNLRLLLDRYSVEVFVNEGEKVMFFIPLWSLTELFLIQMEPPVSML
jgi:hypothetical protein